jgi:hypothetical protein
MNTGFKACKTLVALKLHFTSKSYDYFKYDGEVKFTPNSFEIRKDKYQCQKLARKHSDEREFEDFAATVYAHAEYPKKLWTTDFLTDKAEKTYEKSLKYTGSLPYNFTKELVFVMQKGVDAGVGINWVFEGNPPPFISMLFKEIISLEFCCILEQRLGMIESWKEHEGDVFYDQFASRVSRFRPFLMRRCFPNADISVISACIEGAVKKFK